MPTGPLDEIVGLAKLAEDLGYQRCWVYDEGLHSHDVYVTLSAIAGATSTIKLGPGITNPFVRHPGATASAIASLDQLSGGRAFLGLGAGGSLTLGPLAITRVKPVTAVSDMVWCLRRLFAGETVDHHGVAFGFHQARLDTIGPGSRADIEIILAGRGPRITALGASIGDGFVLSYIHKALLASHAAEVSEKASATDAGGVGRPFSISYSTKVVTTDEAFEQARAQLTFRLVDSPPPVKDLIGLDQAGTNRLRQVLAQGGPSEAAGLIDPDWVDHFVLVGTVEQCASEVAHLMATTAIDEFQLPVHPGPAAADLIQSFAPSRSSSD